MPCHETEDDGVPTQHGVQGREKEGYMNRKSPLLQSPTTTLRQSILVMQMQMVDSIKMVLQLMLLNDTHYATMTLSHITYILLDLLV